MKRRDLIKSLAISALGAGCWLTAANPASAGEVASTADPDERTLGVGESVRFDRSLRVTFLKVGNDSRCPMNARCITAGDAEVVLKIKVAAKKPQIVTLHTHEDPHYVVISALPEGMIGIPKSYTVRLASLSPQRIAGQKLRQRDYRLVLDFSIAV